MPRLTRVGDRERRTGTVVSDVHRSYVSRFGREAWLRGHKVYFSLRLAVWGRGATQRLPW